MAGIVHLIADTEHRHGRMVAVLENGLLPGVVVHGQIFLVSLIVIIVGKTNLHMDQQTQLVCRTDKILRGNGAVETHKVEAILLCLTDVLEGGFVIAAAGHIGMVMGNNATDIATQIDGRIVQKHHLVLHRTQGVVAKALRLAASFAGIQHRVVNGPQLQIGRIQYSAIAVITGCAAHDGTYDCITGQITDNDVALLPGDNKQQLCGSITVNVHFRFPHIHYI